MSQGTLFFQPIQHVFAAAQVVPNCKAYFYLAGSTTPVSVYSDVLLTTAYTQPVVADANGVFAEIFLTPGTAYKVDLQTSAGVSLTGYPADNQLAIPASSATVDQSETAGEALTAGLVVYLSDGSGGKTQGQLYKADSANTYSSSAPMVGIVPSAIASAATGNFRISGQVTGLAGLTVGADYFVGTSGALTTTAPANARYVGRADSTSSLIVAANPPPTFISPVLRTSIVTPATAGLGFGVCQGRLTLTTGTPVTTSDVTAAVTIYWTPYLGNNIGLYDGSTNWTILPFAETSQALGTLTSALPYDVFAYNNSGTLALELLAWTSASARATALVLQNGVLVKTGATTRRYLGTFYTTSTTTTEDSLAKRDVFNYYNRVPRLLQVTDATNFAYTTATYQQYRAQAANQIELITGVAEEPISVWANGFATNTTGAGADVSIGEDSTTTPATGTQSGAVGLSTLAAAAYTKLAATLDKVPTVGWHRYVWLQESQAAGTTNWRGADTVPYVLAGIFGRARQ